MERIADTNGNMLAPAAAVFDNQIYCFGYNDTQAGDDLCSTAERFDLVSMRWYSLRAIPRAWCRGSAVVLPNRCIALLGGSMVGGDTGTEHLVDHVRVIRMSVPTRNVLLYHPDTDTYSDAPWSLPFPADRCSAFVAPRSDADESCTPHASQHEYGAILETVVPRLPPVLRRIILEYLATFLIVVSADERKAICCDVGQLTITPVSPPDWTTVGAPAPESALSAAFEMAEEAIK